MTLNPAQEQPNTRFISGVSEIANRYDAFIIDIWGVIHDGIRLNTGSKSCLEKMVKAGKKFVFLSNTPYRSSELGRGLSDMGLDSSLFGTNIMTAGESTWEDLSSQKNRKVFLMGRYYDGLLEGVTLVDRVAQADCLVATIGGTYKDGDAPFYAAMELALPLGLPLICANPDLEVQIGERLARCAGHYAQWYKEHGGEVHWHGKPHQPVYDRASEMLGDIDKSRICAIGDSLRTDMTGAQKFGIDGLWNLDGINRDLDEAQAQSLLQEKDLSPVAMMKGFTW
jgi:HAD superfamily hydrolase (TIGR01459 family)